MVQIGARNMQNYALLEVAGKLGKPVLLKRGLSSSLDELLMAADYVLKEGNEDVMLCERGIRTFETATRFTLDLGAVAWLKLHTHLPVIVDPSHAAGDRRLVEPLSRAAAAVGADGIIVEVHEDPEHALCDGPQAMFASGFDDVRARCRRACGAPGQGAGVRHAAAPMTERKSLTPRVVEAIEARLRRRLSPAHAAPGLPGRISRAAPVVVRHAAAHRRDEGRRAAAVTRCCSSATPTRDVTSGTSPAASCARARRRRSRCVASSARSWASSRLTVVAIAEVPSRFDRKRERIHVFAVEVAAGAELRPSEAEIAAVRWARHDALPPDTTVFARRMIARAYWEIFR